MEPSQNTTTPLPQINNRGWNRSRLRNLRDEVEKVGQSEFASAEKLRRVASMDLLRGDRSIDHAPQSSDCILFQLDAWADDDLCTNPRTVLQYNRLHYEAKSGVRPIVIPCAEISTLRNADVASDDDWRQVVNPTVFAKPRVIPDADKPWIFDSNTRLNYYSLAD